MRTLLRHVTPDDPEGWTTYHAIRKSLLWDGGRRYYYRCDHPDDLAPENYAMLFLVSDDPVGVVRIDLKKERRQVVFRRAAIAVPERRKGYGTMLMQAAEVFARERGCETGIVYASPREVSFYLKLGYTLDLDSGAKDGETMRMTKFTTRAVEREKRLVLTPRNPSLAPESPLRLPRKSRFSV